MEARELQTVSLVEHQHLAEMQETLNRRLVEAHKKEQSGRGRNAGIRMLVLSLVVGESYDRAREEMRAYVGSRDAYPGFQDRASRYVQHGCDLVQAIQTKRSFPGLASLSLAKQQEIHEKVLEHFEELKQNLKQIERVEREQRLDDVRSTVWVVRTFAQVLVACTVVYFLTDLNNGMFDTLIRVVDIYVNEASIWLVGLLG